MQGFNNFLVGWVKGWCYAKREIADDQIKAIFGNVGVFKPDLLLGIAAIDYSIWM
jgi:hypothetical protein